MSKKMRISAVSIFGTLLAVIVITLLVVAAPRSAEAVLVDLDVSTDVVQAGDTVTFTTTVEMEPGEVVPVYNAILGIYSDPGCTDLVTQCTMTEFSVDSEKIQPQYDYRYGHDHRDGYGYYFGWGWGYGYDYQPCYGEYPVTLTFVCTISTDTLGTGTYYARTQFNPVGPNPSPSPWPSPWSPCVTADFLSDVEPFRVTESGLAVSYTLYADVEPAGAGMVTKNPDAIAYEDGATVAVTANASPGYFFDHWSGDLSGTDPSGSVYMNFHKSVTAHFQAPPPPPGVGLGGLLDGQGRANECIRVTFSGGQASLVPCE